MQWVNESSVSYLSGLFSFTISSPGDLKAFFDITSDINMFLSAASNFLDRYFAYGL